MASNIRDTGSDGEPLLGAHDPSPVAVINPAGASSFLLIGDHAGKRVPEQLKSLGLDDAELSRHIGWDIGIGTLGPMLAEALDAPFVRQAYSRLVIDCNRDPARADAIPEASDGTAIPGNLDLTPERRVARAAAVQAPYQQRIAAELARLDAAGRATVLVSLHSFTPVMAGFRRPWQVGVLHDGGSTAYARRVLDRLRRESDLTVGDNEPYSMDGIDYTIPLHAYAAARDYVEIEIRQDLLTSTRGCAAWSERLARVLADARR